MTDKLIGKSIHDYEIHGLAGSGSFAKVWRAKNPLTEEEVAIKILNQSTGEREIKKFMHVVKLWKGIKHPHIVQVYNAGVVKGTGTRNDEHPFIILEYMPEGTLKQLVEGTKSFLPEDKVISIAKQSLEALVHLHKKEILNLDEHQSNFLFRNINELGMSDFGQAKWMEEAGYIRHSGKESGTVGISKYRALEQMNPHIGEIDQRTDIYQFGATLYFALTKISPIGSWPDVVDVNPDASLELVQIIDKSMKGYPKDRFQSAQNFLDAFTELEESRNASKKYQTSHINPFYKLVGKSGMLTAEEVLRAYQYMWDVESEFGQGELLEKMQGKFDSKRSKDEKIINKYMNQPKPESGSTDAKQRQENIQKYGEIAHFYEHPLADDCTFYQEVILGKK